MEQSNKQNELGPMKWLLLVGVLLYAIWSILTWPFRAILERWPGRRERIAAC
jgi:hypothetical protein